MSARWHTVYEVRHLASGRFYIGCHTTADAYDKYLGSGARIMASVKEHGRAAHEKLILGYHPSRRGAVEHEKMLIRQFCADPLCMNSPLGIGDFGAEEASAARSQLWTKERRAALSASRKGAANPFWGRKHTAESRRKISEASTGEKNGHWGKSHSAETKKRLSEIHKGKTIADWHKKRIGDAARGPRPRSACQHCGKVISDTNFAKYHGDKCKWKAA